MKNLLALTLLVFSLNLFAADEIKIENAKMRLIPSTAPATAIFLKMINNSHNNVKLLSVTGEFAGKFELHDMEMSDKKMVMRKLDFIEIKKKSETSLQSGGLHIMVFKLKSPLKAGDIHKINLNFSDKSVVTTDVIVEKM